MGCTPLLLPGLFGLVAAMFLRKGDLLRHPHLRPCGSFWEMPEGTVVQVENQHFNPKQGRGCALRSRKCSSICLQMCQCILDPKTLKLPGPSLYCAPAFCTRGLTSLLAFLFYREEDSVTVLCGALIKIREATATKQSFQNPSPGFPGCRAACTDTQNH